MASSKLSILKTRFQGETQWDSVIGNVLQIDSDDSHCIINEQSKEYIGGYYLTFSFYNQTLFNIEENKFETVPIRKQSVVKFDIFILSERILLWGNKRTSDLFITSLTQASDNKLIIDSSNAEFKHTVKRLLTIKNIKFSKMRITNVVIDEGIVANCCVNLASLDDPCRMVGKYMECISQLTAVIGKEVNPVSITLYVSGSIVISKDREAIDDETLEIINDIVGGGF